ncbi:response regulator [Microvirga antarctica]|uniref:response regulator n=1 Tax=Microvirga antarctica TaxID=2819233 RepID=UPI001B316980|nr:response regulator transcription factor [Microvirga antarctica]
MADKTIRIAVVDDHPIYREGIIYALTSEQDFEIVGEGGTADEALSLCDGHAPDVVILDVAMPGGGLSAVAAIKRRHPGINIIMLTVDDGLESVRQALQEGARGYLLKGTASAELVQIVRLIHAGGTYVPPSLAADLLFEIEERAPVGQDLKSWHEPLSEREEEILKMIGLASSNKEIAARMGLSEKTVKWHVTRILQKLNVKKRLQAAMVVASRGKR